MRQLGTAQTLILVDLFGATPCNVASKLVDGIDSRLLTGVNLPMLLRAMSHRHETLESLSGRAMMGEPPRALSPLRAPHRRTSHAGPLMIKTSTTISNKLGLHARASAKLTKLAGSFPCEVWLSRGERRINAKSIKGVMMLAAGSAARSCSRPTASRSARRWMRCLR